MSTLVKAFSIQLNNEDRKKAIKKELESKDVSELLSEIQEGDIFSLNSRSNIGKYIELLEIIAEFASGKEIDHLINEDRYSGN